MNRAIAINRLIWTILILPLCFSKLETLGCFSKVETLEESGKVISTPNGQVKGRIIISPTGKTLHAFLGIPYAEPPLGELRFRNAVPKKPWDGILETKEYPVGCFEKMRNPIKVLRGGFRMLSSTPPSEDCLFLNVFSPANASGNAVMLFLHGGAFSFGSSTSPGYNVEVFAAEEEIVVVTLNYRVASFGFLYLEHPDVDHNVGLMDQVQVLKWIQENIASFGGDPERVTLFGSSAGAVSAGFHLISPISRNLFHQVVVHGGSPLAPWGTRSNERILMQSMKLAENVNCVKDGNLSATIECMRAIDGEELLNMEPWIEYDGLIYWPVIDGKFLPDPSLDAFNKGDFKKCNILTGTARDDGVLFLGILSPETFLPFLKKISPRKSDFDFLVEYLSENETEPIKKMIEYEYTDYENVDNPESIFNSCKAIVDDRLFKCPITQLAKYYAEAGQNVYEFQFSHRADQTDWNDWYGVAHTEELRYIFGQVLKEGSKFEEEEKQLSWRMMRYWANFIRTGDPNSDVSSITPVLWPKFDRKKQEYIEFFKTNSKIGHRLRENQCHFFGTFLPSIRVALGIEPKKLSVF